MSGATECFSEATIHFRLLRPKASKTSYRPEDQKILKKALLVYFEPRPKSSKNIRRRASKGKVPARPILPNSRDPERLEATSMINLSRSTFQVPQNGCMNSAGGRRQYVPPDQSQARALLSSPAQQFDTRLCGSLILRWGSIPCAMCYGLPGKDGWPWYTISGLIIVDRESSRDTLIERPERSPLVR